MKDTSAAGFHPVPGFTPPSTQRGERAVREILDAARSHLLDVGVDDFSLREVARLAGYSPAALYNHFAGVETIVNLLALEAVQALGAYLERVSPDLPAPRRLQALGEAYLLFAVEQPARYELAFGTLAAPQTSWEAYVEIAYPFTLLVDACADGLAAGELTDPRQVGASGLAYALWSTVHGIVMLSGHQLGNIERAAIETLAGSAIDIVITGMTREGTPA